jgi:signal transduction histidine kinase/CheY-like chemotaxis protein
VTVSSARPFEAYVPRGAPAAIWFIAVAGVAVAGVLAATGAVGRVPLAVLVGTTITVASLSCVTRAVLAPAERGAWLMLAVGKLGWAITSAGYLANDDAVRQFPTLADIGLVFYPATAIGFVLLARRRLRGLPRALWLDAAIGGAALAAVGAAVLYEPLLDGSTSPSAGKVALVYALADLGLAGLMAVACLFANWRRARTLLLLAVGAGATALADGAFAVGVDHGQLAAQPLVAVGWAAAIVVISAASAFDDGGPGEVSEPGWDLVAVPLVASVAAIAILAANTTGHQSFGVILAEGVLLLAVARLAVSLIDNRRAEERRAREGEARRAREEAERANQAKTRFLSHMSHEMRTPLNSILGFAQLLVDDLDGPDRTSVERILRAGNHLRRLIDDVLDLSAIEAGQTVMSLQPTELAPAIEESVGLLDPLARRSGRGVVVRDAGDAPSAVVADAQRLKQVLLNLISNAIKYGGAESEVVVSVERDGACALIKVIDAGPGIADEDMAGLFTPFERGSARRSGIEGSGIGLALTKSLVETMDGTIAVDTGPSGTTFSFTLPIAELESGGAVGEAREAPAATPAARERCVLYIEDQVSNIALVERLLERRGGFELLTATTGRAGLKLARTVRPDVVLLDLDLPDVQGEDVLAELRADPATAGVPVIVVSADATGWRQEELARAGADAYVVKPIQLAAFMATLDGVLAGSEPARR